METGKLIVALDVETLDEGKKLIDQLGDAVKIYKIGSQLFTACGPVVVQHVLSKGKQVFLDLKFHDIPNTVASAVTSAANLGGVMMCTLHTQGGAEMMKQAAAAARQSQLKGLAKMILVGITVLTSDEKTDGLRDLVLTRAALAKESGLDGVVASVEEAPFIRKKFGNDFVIVTPGIRPAGTDAGDQKRVATPFDAVQAGSNYLVVGRPILKAANPLQAAKDILKQIDQAKSPAG